MTCNILTLDGGGSWALIEVRTLIELFGEDATGHQVLSHFDMVAANSGGSIVLAGLVENKTLGDVLSLFKDAANRQAIFSPTTSLVNKSLSWISGIGPKYSADAKLPALQKLLPVSGGLTLGQNAAGIPGPSGKPVHLLIIGFDYDRNRAAFFRSETVDNGNGYGEAATVSLAGAVHASTNAPVNFFDGPAKIDGDVDWYWDGGITGNNNPALAACVEAASMDHAPGDIRILSLGTATVCLPLADRGAAASPFYAARTTPSLTTDLGKLAASILDDPPDFASFAVHMLTGGSAGLPQGTDSRIVRLNPMISPAPDPDVLWTTPTGWTSAQFQQLCSLGMDALADQDIQYIDAWCDLWIADGAPNQPVRMNGNTLQPEIGAATFSDAVQCWSRLTGFKPANVIAVSAVA